MDGDDTLSNVLKTLMILVALATVYVCVYFCGFCRGRVPDPEDDSSDYLHGFWLSHRLYDGSDFFDRPGGLQQHSV
jgi:hypothetical protein